MRRLAIAAVLLMLAAPAAVAKPHKHARFTTTERIDILSRRISALTKRLEAQETFTVDALNCFSYSIGMDAILLPTQPEWFMTWSKAAKPDIWLVTFDASLCGPSARSFRPRLLPH